MSRHTPTTRFFFDPQSSTDTLAKDQVTDREAKQPEVTMTTAPKCTPGLLPVMAPITQPTMGTMLLSHNHLLMPQSTIQSATVVTSANMLPMTDASVGTMP